MTMTKTMAKWGWLFLFFAMMAMTSYVWVSSYGEPKKPAGAEKRAEPELEKQQAPPPKRYKSREDLQPKLPTQRRDGDAPQRFESQPSARDREPEPLQDPSPIPIPEPLIPDDRGRVDNAYPPEPPPGDEVNDFDFEGEDGPAFDPIQQGLDPRQDLPPSDLIDRLRNNPTDRPPPLDPVDPIEPMDQIPAPYEPDYQVPLDGEGYEIEPPIDSEDY